MVKYQQHGFDRYGVAAWEDCDDGDSIIGSSTSDADCDGVATADDCDDNDPTIYPFAGDAYGDGIDSDCDGLDCEAESDGSTYYVACNDTIDWSSAESLCVSSGNDSLASVLTSSENTFLYNLINATTSSYTGYWIGLHDTVAEGDYVWSDGSAGSYFNWHANEPDGSPSKNCVALLSNGGVNSMGWSDSECSNQLQGFTCSRR